MLRYALILLITGFATIKNATAQSYFEDEYLNVWQRATEYTLEVADKMPDSLYDYRPAEESMSFKEQQLHIVSNISFLTNYITGKYQKFYEVDELRKLKKEEVLDILLASLQYVNQLIVIYNQDSVREVVEFKRTKMSKENIFYLIRNHLSHHRAQSILYMRMNNIDPPAYVGW